MNSPQSTILINKNSQPRQRTLLCCSALFLFAISLLAYPVLASAICEELARSEMEQAYCRIKASGHGKSLPNLQDFRNNPESMQRLLLKGPARKAKVTLPEAAKQATVAPSAPPVRQEQTARPTSAISQKARTDTSGITRCILQRNQIQCGSDYYLLRTNLPNHEIQSTALQAGNKLELPDEKSLQYRNSSRLQYLSDCYPMYIEKMLSIGLGDSTMSFTRFAAMHEEITKNNADFAKRFYEMFELLKVEKSKNAVRRRYSNDYPSSIEQCLFLSSQTIVCDNVEKNWVYQR